MNRVSQVMSRNVITVAPDASCHDAITLMTRDKIRHLPVVGSDGALCAWVVFSDQNGAKGGLDIRCGITVSVGGRSRLHAQDQAATPRQALDGALAKLERRLLRAETSSRDNRRRPKKYFAAARLLQEGQ